MWSPSKQNELSIILGVHNGALKRLLKDLKLYKEGFKKDDIIWKLMGCRLYNYESLDELAFDLLELDYI